MSSPSWQVSNRFYAVVALEQQVTGRDAVQGGWGPAPTRGLQRAHHCEGLRAQARGKERHLGTFTSPEAAAWAYDCTKVAVHGKMGRFNYPEYAQAKGPVRELADLPDEHFKAALKGIAKVRPRPRRLL